MSDFYYDDDEKEELHAEGIYGDEDDYGRCPVCGGSGEMIAEGRKHWMVCHEDQTKWRIGTGFFSMFQRDRPKQWDRPRELLAAYREVQPLHGDEAEKSEIERFRRLFE
jgi:hypothetical protein